MYTNRARERGEAWKERSNNMNDNNTLKARYFYYLKDGLHMKGKEYNWHIPKKLRSEKIKTGDMVLVRDRQGKEVRAVVTEVFRENIEETGKAYTSILDKWSGGKRKKNVGARQGKRVGAAGRASEQANGEKKIEPKITEASDEQGRTD